MDLTLDESQTILCETFTDLLERECPTSHVRACEEAGHSPGLWARYVELGAPGMGLPESAGGLGMGLLELALVAGCGGRALAPVPFAEVAAAGRLLASLGADDPLVARVASGDAIVSILPSRPHAVRGTHGPVPEGGLVPFGSVAEAVLALVGDELVVASGAETRASARLDDVGSGALASWDVSARGRRGARRVLARGEDARAAMARGVAEWKLLIASALVGLARRALELGAGYAKERIQFGAPIGGFQAIAHPLAECATRVDGAELLVWEAAWSRTAEPERFEALSSMAFAWAAQTARRTTDTSLHTHGGYGFSLEYDIQLYYRRACALAAVAGGAREELARVAELCCAPPAASAAAAPKGGA